MAQKPDTGWNFFYTGWGTQPALGPLDTVAFLAPPTSLYMPKDNKPDPDLAQAWTDMNTKPTAEERQAAFARAQTIILTKVLAVPFGSFTKVQATRATVQGFKPFRIPRVSNVWFTN